MEMFLFHFLKTFFGHLLEYDIVPNQSPAEQSLFLFYVYFLFNFHNLGLFTVKNCPVFVFFFLDKIAMSLKCKMYIFVFIHSVVKQTKIVNIFIYRVCFLLFLLLCCIIAKTMPTAHSEVLTVLRFHFLFFFLNRCLLPDQALTRLKMLIYTLVAFPSP